MTARAFPETWKLDVKSRANIETFPTIGNTFNESQELLRIADEELPELQMRFVLVVERKSRKEFSLNFVLFQLTMT